MQGSLFRPNVRLRQKLDNHQKDRNSWEARERSEREREGKQCNSTQARDKRWKTGSVKILDPYVTATLVLCLHPSLTAPWETLSLQWSLPYLSTYFKWFLLLQPFSMLYLHTIMWLFLDIYLPSLFSFTWSKRDFLPPPSHAKVETMM